MRKLFQKMIDDFQELGVSFIPKLFKKHIDNLRKGIEFNIQNPGPCSRKSSKHEKDVFLTIIVTGIEFLNLRKLFLIMT